MLILERLSLLSMPWLLRKSGCQCRRVLVLNDNWLTRFIGPQRWYRRIEGRHRGRGVVLASLCSVSLTEMLLDRWGIDQNAEKSLMAFFQNREILLAFRKFSAEWIEGLVALYEAGLSQAISCNCQNVLFVASRVESWRVIQCWKDIQQQKMKPDRIQVTIARVASVIATIGAWLYSLAAGAALIGAVASQILRQGLCLRVPKRQHFRILMHDYWDLSHGRPWDIRAADFLVDRERLHPKDIFVVLSRQSIEKQRRKQYADAGLICRGLREIPFSIPFMLDLWPRLLKAVYRLLVPSQAVTFARRRVVGTVLYGMSLENLMGHYSFGAVLSCEEHSHVHIAETAVLNRFRTKTVWIPHSVSLKPGYSSSYLSYNLFPSPGSFIANLNNRTWSEHMAIKIVGLPANDGIRGGRSMLAREEVRRQLDGLKATHRIIAAFTGSYSADDFVNDRYLKFLRMLVKLVEIETTIKVIIKPKANEEWPEHADFLSVEPFKSVLGPCVKDGRIIVLNPRNGFACSAQYLIAKSDVSVSTAQYAMFGSVWAEALLLGKPSFAFAPAEFRHAPYAQMLYDRWIFDDEERMVVEISRALRSERDASAEDKIRDSFDPYRDGHALDRLRTEIVSLLTPDLGHKSVWPSESAPHQLAANSESAERSRR